MLIECPECEKKVSDRAAACPDCGFPIREWVAEEQEKQERKQEVESREEVGEVDCVACGARGFVMLDEKMHGRSGFTWCAVCGHSGRVVLCQASDRYYAVSQVQLEGFLAGELGAESPGINYVGKKKPEGFQYPEAGMRTEYDTIPDWYAKILPKLCGEE